MKKIEIAILFLLLGSVTIAEPGKIYKYDYRYPIDSCDGWKHRIEVTATPTPIGYIAPTPIPAKPAPILKSKTKVYFAAKLSPIITPILRKK